VGQDKRDTVESEVVLWVQVAKNKCQDGWEVCQHANGSHIFHKMWQIKQKWLTNYHVIKCS